MMFSVAFRKRVWGLMALDVFLAAIWGFMVIPAAFKTNNALLTVAIVVSTVLILTDIVAGIVILIKGKY